MSYPIRNYTFFKKHAYKAFFYQKERKEIYDKAYHTYLEDKNFNKAYASYQVGVENITTKSTKKMMYQYRNLKLERLADKYAYAIYLLNEQSAIAFDKKMRQQFAQ